MPRPSQPKNHRSNRFANFIAYNLADNQFCIKQNRDMPRHHILPIFFTKLIILTALFSKKQQLPHQLHVSFHNT